MFGCKARSRRRFFALCLVCILSFSHLLSVPADAAGETVIPGGIPFGVRFTTDGVFVVGYCEVGNGENPAKSAGIRPRDVLIALDGTELRGAADLSERINESGGTPVTLSYRRGGATGNVTLNPVPDGTGGFRTGLYVRDSGAGIGTVTFVFAENGTFAGLGHGICDTETGELLPFKRGNVLDVTVSGVTPGTPGKPGEVRGFFAGSKTGTLLDNTGKGVFGIYASLPGELPRETVTVAAPEEVQEGEAILLCTLSSNTRRAFRVEISNVDAAAEGAKCFTVRVTDPDLLAETGGIVQGMSGSPLLQNGKLIGAVTHVMISNPTVGYGIFIDNMLSAMPERLLP